MRRLPSAVYAPLKAAPEKKGIPDAMNAMSSPARTFKIFRCPSGKKSFCEPFRIGGNTEPNNGWKTKKRDTCARNAATSSLGEPSDAMSARCRLTSIKSHIKIVYDSNVGRDVRTA